MQRTPEQLKAREQSRIRVNSPKLTDQSQAAASDINNIADQFQRTGILPQPVRIPKYQDNTQTPTLEDAFRAVSEAKLAFQSLPAEVRKLMDNDPLKMEAFISDEKNGDLLLKYGIIEIPKQEPTKATLDDVVSELKKSKKPTEQV